MKKHRHFLVHKPYGFLSQFITNQKTRKKQGLLGELYDFPEGTMAIGRLDFSSEGLLLLTTDGKVSDYITTRGGVEKEYYVQVDGEIGEIQLEQLRQGVEISVGGNKYLTKPCKVFKIEKPNFEERIKPVRDDRHGPSTWISITLKEGKFRQVRKMTAVVGMPTLRLVRVRVGVNILGDLSSGQVVEVEELV